MSDYGEYVIYAFFLFPIVGICGYSLARLFINRCYIPEDLQVVIPIHSVEIIHSVEPLEVAHPIEIYIPQKDPIQTAETLSLPDDHVLIYI